MSALSEAIAQLHAALRTLRHARGTLTHAGELLHEAGHHLDHATTGSHNPEAEQATGLMAQASSDADGNVHAEVSGKDDKYNEAIGLFKRMKARRIPLRASDVEMKLAVHMRINGIRSATLIINHIPCDGALGCDALVPVILPEGYTLTIYGANGFVREYQGGKTSAWLP